MLYFGNFNYSVTHKKPPTGTPTSNFPPISTHFVRGRTLPGLSGMAKFLITPEKLRKLFARQPQIRLPAGQKRPRTKRLTANLPSPGRRRYQLAGCMSGPKHRHLLKATKIQGEKRRRRRRTHRVRDEKALTGRERHQRARRTDVSSQQSEDFFVNSLCAPSSSTVSLVSLCPSVGCCRCVSLFHAFQIWSPDTHIENEKVKGNATMGTRCVCLSISHVMLQCVISHPWTHQQCTKADFCARLGMIKVHRAQRAPDPVCCWWVAAFN